MQHLRSKMSTDVHRFFFKYIRLHKNYIEIEFRPGYTYQIELDRCRTANEICNWLGQIEEKSWCNTTILGELVKAFTEVNGDLRDVH